MMDLTSLWVFYRKHKSRGGLFLLVVISFMLGWQLSKFTSPYYSAQPVIFSDRDCAQCSSATATTQDLNQLKQQGIVRREKSKSTVPDYNKPTATPSPTNQPAVAGTASGSFVGSINSNLFHDPSCSSAKRIKEENQIWFSSIEEAQKSGYSPSKCTRNKLSL